MRGNQLTGNLLVTNPVNDHHASKITFPNYQFTNKETTKEQRNTLLNDIKKALKPLNIKYNEVMQQLEKVNNKLAEEGISKTLFEELKQKQTQLQKQEAAITNEMTKLMEKELQKFMQELNTNSKWNPKQEKPQEKQVQLKGMLSDNYNSRIQAKKQHLREADKADYIKHKQETKPTTVNDLKALQRQKRAEAQENKKVEVRGL